MINNFYFETHYTKSYQVKKFMQTSISSIK